MNFSELKVGDKLRQRSYEDSWEFWDFGEGDAEVIKTLADYVGNLGFGKQVVEVVSIEYKDYIQPWRAPGKQNAGKAYHVKVSPPLFEVLAGKERSIENIVSCTYCEGLSEEKLGCCGNPCWNCLLERVPDGV